MDLDGESLVPYMGGQAAGRDAGQAAGRATSRDAGRISDIRDASERTTLSERLDWAPGNRRTVHNKDKKERFMLRYKDYKYCYYTGGKEILYDLKTDPAEYDNKANAPDYAETLRSMREKLRKHLAQSGYGFTADS
jgi:arylsulfatase A-like enzyme